MKLNKEYKEISNDILNNENFELLKNDIHHGTSKYAHCKRVSYLSFLLSKIFGGNSKKVVRAGLLHDFFFGTRTAKEENSYFKHPMTSVKNARKYFEIDEKEANIIKSHMFHYAFIKNLTPFINKEEKEYYKSYKPQSKESIIVCVSDLLVSIFEVCAFKIRYNTSLYLIFILNLLHY